MSKAVRPDGTPTRARDERGILLDLSARDVEAMAKREPGSPARYLEERRKEIAAEEAKKLEQADKARYIKEFLAAGGTSRTEGEAAYRAHRNQQAAATAREADQAAATALRLRIASRL
jgi:hypothetical protein